MERIGNQKTWSYCTNQKKSCPFSNSTIRASDGHPVESYAELAKKVAELQFLNRDYVLLFRGQVKDYRTVKGNSMIKPSIFRLENGKVPSPTIMIHRFSSLRKAEICLVQQYVEKRLLGVERIKRHRILRWAVLQHYKMCVTPLLDVTHSIRIAASFASNKKTHGDPAYIYVFGVPNLNGAVTSSSEAGLQVVRLSSACPPDALRPHFQDGYLLGEYPEIADFYQTAEYSYFEMDFGRRLVTLMHRRGGR